MEEIIDVDAIEEDGDTWMEPLELERVEENVGMAVTRSAGKRKQREEDMEDQPKAKETHKQPKIPVNLPGPLTISGSKPAFTYESKAEDPNAATKMFQRTLDVVVPDVTIRDLVSLSSDLQKQWIDHTKVQHIPTTTDEPTIQATIRTKESLNLEYSTPVQMIEVMLFGRQKETALIDDGAEIVIIRADVCKEMGLQINPEKMVTMETANGSCERMEGGTEYLEIVVDGLVTWAHAFVVTNSPF
ncbi:hypothetical protein LENED_007565 [Lentinula edodes]|uniref:Uncharacterized protein n=1 Tax=Lentinula edodes TaxID=5353 RepID=A0A1Q3EEU2_LENED|nr:hypothetical protein LENED_007565 [Lentinula edodes]